MGGNLARILAPSLLLVEERKAMERSMKFHRDWLAAFQSDVGIYAVGALIEDLCLRLDVCQQKLKIEQEKNDSNNRIPW